ncbi:MAG: hypothetical protein COV67_07845 [Nitrospinae bacterium CG11_big_fil_rev_8_21_14_0_20_56_8]|nr:MAG: hypothetical protein COV67_07845 [Nitrospinae bacterium CG11_big_fil_rev_8_21_14_0_20_56_8]
MGDSRRKAGKRRASTAFANLPVGRNLGPYDNIGEDKLSPGKEFFFPADSGIDLNTVIPNISVVVLAYRSGKTIGAFVETLVKVLEKAEPEWEIVLVGNYHEGAEDSTPAEVRRIAEGHPRIRSVVKVKDGMMGWDMKSGLAAATGKTLAVIDGDGQMPAEDVGRVYSLLKDRNLDLAKTYRVSRDDGPYRVFMSRVYNRVFGFLFPGLECRDVNSKPKIFTRAVYVRMDLESNGWFIDAELMIKARRMKLKTGELETVFRSLHSRPSFVRPLTTLAFVANLFWYRLLECRWWFQRPD